MSAPIELPEIRIVRRETHTSPAYQWDNRSRLPDQGLVIQRTLSGSCGFSRGNFRTEVVPGQAMLFQHGEDSRYGITPDSELPYVTEYMILDPGAGIGELFKGLRTRYGPVLRMATGGEAHRLLLQLLLEFNAGRPADRLSLAESSYRVLLSLYREQNQATQQRDPVAYGRHLLETRCREGKNLKEWCGEIGLSREHFSREFSARFGETPAAFLRRHRLGHAQRLLKLSPRLPLEDIATLSGFASVQTFRRAYKRRFGDSASPLATNLQDGA